MFNNQTDYLFEKIINAIFLILFIIGLGTTVILAISNTSPARELNILQATLMDGSYFPVLSALLLVIPFVIFIMVSKLVLVLFFNLLFAKDGKKIPYFYKLRW